MVPSTRQCGGVRGGTSTRERVALALSLAALATTIAAGSAPMLGLDLYVYRAIQAADPSAVHGAGHALDLAARALLAVVIVAGCIVARRRNTRRSLIETTLLIAIGGAVGELLKTAIERLRPSALPDFATGNSVPSGHIMNTTLFAVAAWDLAGAMPRGWRRAARALSVTAVAMQCAARVMRGSHWPSDIAPSVLLALAWMLGAGALWRMRGLRAPLVVGGLTAYAAFWAVPAIRVHVPSVLDRPRITLTAWQPDDDAAPVKRATLRSDQDTPTTVEAVLRVACEPRNIDCHRARVSVNGWTSPDIALGCGWRWYDVRPDPAVLHVGDNDIAIAAAPGCAGGDRQRVAIRSIALVADAAPVPFVAAHVAAIVPSS